MDFDQWDPNAEVICPYDPLHVISVKRFQRHLIKCRKNHPEKDFIACPFNARHMFHRSELKHHIAHCPDRKTIDHDIQATQCPETGDILRAKGKTDMPTPNYVVPEPQEDWDGEIEVNLARKYTDEQQEILRKTRSALPIIRRPQIFFDESEKNSDNSYRESDTSDIASYSSRSSLYAKPVKYSNVKDKIGHAILGQTNNKPAVGRGALLHENRIPKSKGRGSAITLLQNIRQPNVDGVSNHQQNMKSLGRGQLMETAMKLKNSSR